MNVDEKNGIEFEKNYQIQEDGADESDNEILGLTEEEIFHMNAMDEDGSKNVVSEDKISITEVDKENNEEEMRENENELNSQHEVIEEKKSEGEKKT